MESSFSSARGFSERPCNHFAENDFCTKLRFENVSALRSPPDFAVPALDALVKAGHDVAAVYSQPPRPAGRGKGLRASPVHLRAEELGLEVRTPPSLKDAETQAAFAALNADVAVVAAYGLILPAAILAAPRQGCMNIHASLLPRWRGAAPIQRAILSGDNVTGVTIMDMEAGLDTGPMRAKHVTPIEDKTAGALTQELADAGAELMVEVLDALSLPPPMPQPAEGVTYAAKIDKAEMRLDWNRPAPELANLVRALSPVPGAWFQHGAARIKLRYARAICSMMASGDVFASTAIRSTRRRSLRGN